ncbi:unnamed protein product, partial [Symbiodinium necroappetens]
ESVQPPCVAPPGKMPLPGILKASAVQDTLVDVASQDPSRADTQQWDGTPGFARMGTAETVHSDATTLALPGRNSSVADLATLDKDLLQEFEKADLDDYDPELEAALKAAQLAEELAEAARKEASVRRLVQQAAEQKAQETLEEQKRREAEVLAQKAAERQKAQEAEEQKRKEAELLAQAAEEQKAREAELRKRVEAEVLARLVAEREAEEQKRRDAALLAQAAAEQKARAAQEQKLLEAELLAQAAAEQKARETEEQKRVEAALLAQKAAEQKAREAEEQKRVEAELLAQKAAEQKAREAQEQKRVEAELLAQKAAAEQRVLEASEAGKRLEAELKSRLEAAAKQKAKEAQEREHKEAKAVERLAAEAEEHTRKEAEHLAETAAEQKAGETEEQKRKAEVRARKMQDAKDRLHMAEKMKEIQEQAMKEELAKASAEDAKAQLKAHTPVRSLSLLTSAASFTDESLEDTSAASSVKPELRPAAKGRGAKKAQKDSDCELPQLSEEEVVKYKGWWNRLRSFEQPGDSQAAAATVEAPAATPAELPNTASPAATELPPVVASLPEIASAGPCPAAEPNPASDAPSPELSALIEKLAREMVLAMQPPAVLNPAWQASPPPPKPNPAEPAAENVPVLPAASAPPPPVGAPDPVPPVTTVAVPPKAPPLNPGRINSSTHPAEYKEFGRFCESNPAASELKAAYAKGGAFKMQAFTKFVKAGCNGLALEAVLRFKKQTEDLQEDEGHYYPYSEIYEFFQKDQAKAEDEISVALGADPVVACELLESYKGNGSEMEVVLLEGSDVPAFISAWVSACTGAEGRFLEQFYVCFALRLEALESQGALIKLIVDAKNGLGEKRKALQFLGPNPKATDVQTILSQAEHHIPDLDMLSGPIDSVAFWKQVMKSDMMHLNADGDNISLEHLQDTLVQSLNVCADRNNGLGFTIHVVSGKGDWKWRKEWLKQTRYYGNAAGKDGLCQRCLASKNTWLDPVHEGFNNAADLAAARPTAVGDIHLKNLLGWQPEMEIPDLLHCCWLGSARDFNGSLCMMVASKFLPGATFDERLATLRSDMQLWCQDNGIRSSTIEEIRILTKYLRRCIFACLYVVGTESAHLSYIYRLRLVENGCGRRLAGLSKWPSQGLREQSPEPCVAHRDFFVVAA